MIFCLVDLYQMSPFNVYTPYKKKKKKIETNSLVDGCMSSYLHKPGDAVSEGTVVLDGGGRP